MKKITNFILCLFLIGQISAKEINKSSVVLPKTVEGEWFSEKGKREYNGLLIHKDFIEFGYRAFMYQDIKKTGSSSYTFSAKDTQGNIINCEINILSKTSIELRRGDMPLMVYNLRKEPKGSKRISMNEVPEVLKKKWFTTNGEDKLEFDLKKKNLVFRNKTYKIEEVIDFKSNSNNEYRFVVKNKKEYWMFYFKNWSNDYLQVGFHGKMGNWYKAVKSHPNGRIKNFSKYAASVHGKRYLSSKKKASQVPEKITKWIDGELAKVKTIPLNDFKSDRFFNRENAKLIGYLKGYDPSLGFKTGILYLGNDIANEDYPIVLQIHEDGRFEADLPISNPIYSKFVLKDKWIPFYIEPGQTLSITLDMFELMQVDRRVTYKNNFKNIEYKGQLAGVNKDLLGFTIKSEDYNSFYNKTKTLTPGQFKTEQEKILKENFKNLSKYKDDKLVLKKNKFANENSGISVGSISNKAAHILKNKIQLENGTRLLDFLMNREYEARKDTVSANLKIKEKNSYYDFLKKMPMDDQSLLVSDEFGTFINRLEFSNPLSIYPKSTTLNFKATKSFLDYLKEIDVKLTKEEILLQVTIDNGDNDKTFYKDNKEELKVFYKKYTKEWKVYNKEYYMVEQNKWFESREISMEKWRLRDSVLTNTLGLEKSLVYDITKIRMLKYDIGGVNIGQAQDYWNRLKTDISNPFLKKEGARVLNKIHPADKVLSYKLPESKSASIFKEIIAPHKGKILFIDFWATSCGPCIGGIKRMKEIRKKHEGNKDFEFVFITDERSSPIGRYNDFVKKQELKNIYRLPLDDYNYLRELFKFNGIPRYVVIDKKGDVLNDNFPMYNFSSELKKILRTMKQVNVNEIKK